MQEDPVDIVIMWVDGASPEFQDIYKSEVARLVSRGINVKDQKGRHRDNGELLFLLRSINMYMPWYRKIFIVTNGQKPRYVDFSSDRISLITHREIFPKKEDAPSFNTFAIESTLHNIPDLSEVFIRFSDDFFLGRQIEPSDLFGESGHGKFFFGTNFFNTDDSVYHRTLQHNAVEFWKKYRYLPLINTLHVPQLRRKSYQKSMIKAWKTWFSSTRRHKFRDTTDAIGLFLYPYFVIQNYQDADFRAHVNDLFRPGSDRGSYYAQINVGTAENWQAKVADLQNKRPIFFNLNDTIPDHLMAEAIRSTSVALHTLFPHPSPYEKVTDNMPGFYTGGLD